MDFDFKIDKIIEIFDLVRAMSWGAIPLWFSLTLPVIYIAYKKLLPNPESTPGKTFVEKVQKFFKLPKMDEMVVYISLAMFVIGTITLKIDQTIKEEIRNNGQRIKAFYIDKNWYQTNFKTLTSVSKGLHDLSYCDIKKVVNVFPSDFILTKDSTLVLIDSLPHLIILKNSEKILDSYLTNSGNRPGYSYSFDSLFSISNFFTYAVINKLLMDSGKKYAYYPMLRNGVKIDYIEIRKKDTAN